MISRGFTERTKGRVHDIKIQTALEVGLLFRNVQVLGMPRPCEHVGGHQSMVGDKIRGSARMRTQVINLRLVTRHDVAGSEAEGILHHLF